MIQVASVTRLSNLLAMKLASELLRDYLVEQKEVKELTDEEADLLVNLEEGIAILENAVNAVKVARKSEVKEGGIN